MVTRPAGSVIPPDLRGPVEVQLARAVEAVPAPNALPGGTVWEPKLDGYRGVIVRGDRARIWSRNGRDLTDRFPDIVRAAEQQLPEGTVVDGVICSPHVCV